MQPKHLLLTYLPVTNIPPQQTPVFMLTRAVYKKQRRIYPPAIRQKIALIVSRLVAQHINTGREKEREIYTYIPKSSTQSMYQSYIS
jgi:hypothetical protein